MCLKIMAFKPWLSSHGCTHFRQFGNIIQRKNSIGLDPPHVSWSIETPERAFDAQSGSTCLTQPVYRKARLQMMLICEIKVTT
jgi:hypothetical protein